MEASHYFPEEIIYRILTWLPVLSLLRFKSVCKQWLSFISHPDFTQTHLTNSLKRPSLLTFAETSRAHKYKYGFSHISHSLEDSFDLPVPSCLVSSQDLWSLSSCNGLVCLSDHKGRYIYVWNPLTQQCCMIKAPNIPSVKWAFTVFCFDSISNEYKIVSISVSRKFPVRVQLCSISSTTAWRDVEVNQVDESLASVISCGPVIKGALYLDGRDELIMFQLRDEMFKLVALPDTRLRVVLNNRSSCFDYEGRVGLILHCYDDESLSLWSLDEDEGSGIVSWTKKLNLGTGFRIDWTSTYLGDRKLVTSENRKRITMYNSRTKEIKKCEHPTWHYVKSAHKFTESFVSLKGFSK